MGGVTVLGLVGALSLRRPLDGLLLGEEKALSLGVNVLALQRSALGNSSAIAGICVALCGVIAFAGLIVPHVCRNYAGSLHARLLPLSALAGALFMVAVDLISRVVDQPHEVPITVITSLVGAPFFVYVLLSRRETVV